MADKSSSPLRAMLLATCVVMPSACGASAHKPRPKAEPDPVIVTRTEVVRVCPAELTAARPSRPAVPDGAVLTGSDAGMAWLSALIGYTGLLEDRLADAGAQCPVAEPGK